MSSLMGVRGGVPRYPQILADQLTLSHPWEGDYAHQLILAPLDFQTFLRPWGFISSLVPRRKEKQKYCLELEIL